MVGAWASEQLADSRGLVDFAAISEWKSLALPKARVSIFSIVFTRFLSVSSCLVLSRELVGGLLCLLAFQAGSERGVGVCR